MIGAPTKHGIGCYNPARCYVTSRQIVEYDERTTRQSKPSKAAIMRRFKIEESRYVESLGSQRLCWLLFLDDKPVRFGGRSRVYLRRSDATRDRTRAFEALYREAVRNHVDKKVERIQRNPEDIWTQLGDRTRRVKGIMQ